MAFILLVPAKQEHDTYELLIDEGATELLDNFVPATEFGDFVYEDALGEVTQEPIDTVTVIYDAGCPRFFEDACLAFVDKQGRHWIAEDRFEDLFA